MPSPWARSLEREHANELRPYSMDAYPYEAMRLARERGWSDQLHQAALDSQNDDLIGSTHPILFLTEDEAERYFA